MRYRTPVWQPRHAPTIRGVPLALRPWLDEPGSLTRRMRSACGEGFGVRVVSEGWASPWPDEIRRLRLRAKRRAWVREVCLCCRDTPWVFARTVVPPVALRGPFRRLTRLGRRPLGAVLFGHYPVQRGVIEIARAGPRDRLWRAAAGSTDARAPGLWARRSVFRIGGRGLLVTEVFLPPLAQESVGFGRS